MYFMNGKKNYASTKLYNIVKSQQNAIRGKFLPLIWKSHSTFKIFYVRY